MEEWLIPLVLLILGAISTFFGGNDSDENTSKPSSSPHKKQSQEYEEEEIEEWDLEEMLRELKGEEPEPIEPETPPMAPPPIPPSAKPTRVAPLKSHAEEPLASPLIEESEEKRSTVAEDFSSAHDLPSIDHLEHSELGNLNVQLADLSGLKGVDVRIPTGGARKLGTSSEKARRLIRELKNKTEIRKAILLNEILQPPVALRDQS